MLPSLGQLPVGAPGPLTLERDFAPMFPPPKVKPPPGVKPNDVCNGRVVDARGNPQHIMDEAERWRHAQLERMQSRRAEGKYQPPTHRTSPIPPVPWENGVEVLADGALVNVLASTLEVPEAAVSVKCVRAAVRAATGQSSATLARAVSTISSTDGDGTLDWWGFRSRLRAAVPALAVVGASWIVGALYSLYLLKEEVQAEAQAQAAAEEVQAQAQAAAEQWLMSMPRFSPSAPATSAAPGNRATLSKSLIH
jgi:hypothetical protein